MIDQDMLELENEFLKIKKKGLIKSMRKGPSGSGYTFETLLGKKEDQESNPDFKSIEIKCKYGFSGKHLGLFTCAPKRNGGQAYNYIYENYAFEKLGNPDEKIFSLLIFSKYTIDKNGFTFKLFVDEAHEMLLLKSYLNNEFLEDICYWSFDALKEKINTKLQKLAVVDCYPYDINNEKYFKYTRMSFYKLKSFEVFLNLIKTDVVCVGTYLKKATDSFGNPIIDCHGFQFRIRKEKLEKLFDKIAVVN